MSIGNINPEQRTRTDLELNVAALRHAFRARVQQDADHHVVTPDGCIAYAGLHLARDDGLPITPASHHRLWLEMLCNEEIRKLLIIAPPESAKTTWALMVYTGLYLGVHPERSIIVSSSSGPIAEKRSLALRNVTTTRAWRMTFPTLAPAIGLPWKTTQWSLAPRGVPHSGRLHPTLSAYGTGGSVTGSRADIIMADDLLTTLNTATPHQRENLKVWFYNTLLSRQKSVTGRAIVIGTAYHHGDLYSDLKRAGDWTVVHIKLYGDNDTQNAVITYPDSYTGARLGVPMSDTQNAFSNPVTP